MKNIFLLILVLFSTKWCISQEVMFPDKPIGSCVDETSLELGMRFVTDDTITITALRFYKCKNDIGTYIVKLYAGSSVVSTARYSGNMVGWVSVQINPVKAVPGIEYVTAYYSPNGIYQAVDDYGWNFSRGDVRAIMSVYKYGSNSNTLPTSFYQTSNYFADIVFTPKIPFYIPIDTVYLPRVCPPDSQNYTERTDTIWMDLYNPDIKDSLPDYLKYWEMRYRLPGTKPMRFIKQRVTIWKREEEQEDGSWIEK